MTAESRPGLRLPNFISRLFSRSPEAPPTRRYPEAPPGTNAYFMALDGIDIKEDWQHYSDAHSHIFGPRETILIRREQEVCEGGDCVEVIYRKPTNEGDIFVHAHVMGDDRMQFGFALKEIGGPQITEPIDVETGFKMVRDRLIELGIPNADNPSPFTDTQPSTQN